MPAPARQAARYTWSDYQTWPDSERWEIIDGAAYNMSPAPSTQHQKIAGRFYSQLELKLAGKRCTPFIAPTDVKLSESNVVQPDILVVCDPAKITPGHIEGAPDLVVEVLSPATALKDLREKKALYQASGVREYLVIDPQENTVQRFVLEAGQRYGEAQTFGPADRLRLAALDNLEIALQDIFA